MSKADGKPAKPHDADSPAAKKPRWKLKQEYDPAFCDRVVELMANGASKTQVAADLGCSMSALRNWIDQHPDFAEAMEKGAIFAEAYWEDRGQEGAMGERKVNPVLWKAFMANRFGWRDNASIEHGGPGGGPIQTHNKHQYQDLPLDEPERIERIIGILSGATGQEKSDDGSSSGDD